MAGLYWHFERFYRTNLLSRPKTHQYWSHTMLNVQIELFSYIQQKNTVLTDWQSFLRQFSNNFCKYGQWAATCYINLFPPCFLVIVLQSSPCNIARLTGPCDLCEHSGHLKSGSDFFELLREWWKTKHACELWLCPN